MMHSKINDRKKRSEGIEILTDLPKFFYKDQSKAEEVGT